MRSTSVRERGNALLVALIALTGLIAIASLTVMSVQGSIATSSADRFSAIALYAAESGAASAMDYLRKNININQNANPPVKTFPKDFVSAGNASPPVLPDIPGNNAQPGDPGNLFRSSMNAWFTVDLLNNRGDAGFNAGHVAGLIARRAGQARAGRKEE